MRSQRKHEHEDVKTRSDQPAAGARDWWQGVKSWLLPEAQPPVEEGSFVPFDLSALRSAANEPSAVPASPQVAPPSPATLAELGLPDELAHGLEVTLRAMGATRHGQVIGYRFRTPDGRQHRLRLGEAA